MWFSGRGLSSIHKALGAKPSITQKNSHLAFTGDITLTCKIKKNSELMINYKEDKNPQVIPGHLMSFKRFSGHGSMVKDRPG